MGAANVQGGINENLLPEACACGNIKNSDGYS
jgi:hypothetical protein